MKILVAFYSFTGRTKKIASSIAGEVGADMLEIKVKRRNGGELFQYFWGGRSVMMEEEPELTLPQQKSADNYDFIFLGTPVWAKTLAPPLSSFLGKAKLRGKKIALFCTHGSGPAKTFEKLRKEIAVAGKANKIVGEMDFKMKNAAPNDRKNNLFLLFPNVYMIFSACHSSSLLTLSLFKN